MLHTLRALPTRTRRARGDGFVLRRGAVAGALPRGAGAAAAAGAGDAVFGRGFVAVAVHGGALAAGAGCFGGADAGAGAVAAGGWFRHLVFSFLAFFLLVRVGVRERERTVQVGKVQRMGSFRVRCWNVGWSGFGLFV